MPKDGAELKKEIDAVYNTAWILWSVSGVGNHAEGPPGPAGPASEDDGWTPERGCLDGAIKTLQIIRERVFEKKETALCKLAGRLVLMEVSPSKKGESGRCPVCGYDRFRLGTGSNKGWTECTNPDGCGFAVLTTHLERTLGPRTRLSKDTPSDAPDSQ